MKMIKTGLYLKNKQQTQDIARGLADTSARLEITELEYKIRYGDHDIEEYDIIITDRDGFDQYHPKVLILGGKWRFEYYDEYERQGQLLDRCATVTDILHAVIRTWEKNEHISFAQRKDRQTSILAFFSSMGGSGVSAAAVTIGRHLAMNSNKKVLYVNAGGSGLWKLYVSYISKASRPSRELPHLIQNDAVYSLESYVGVDRYGLRYLEKPDRPETVLKKLCEINAYDMILVDMPEPFTDIEFDKTYFVQNEKDFRTGLCPADDLSIKSGADFIEIINRSISAGCEDSCIKIPEDRASFVRTENGIEIAMDGDYARNMRKVCEEWI